MKKSTTRFLGGIKTFMLPNLFNIRDKNFRTQTFENHQSPFMYNNVIYNLKTHIIPNFQSGNFHGILFLLLYSIKIIKIRNKNFKIIQLQFIVKVQSDNRFYHFVKIQTKQIKSKNKLNLFNS